jgi:hypothetical protein
MPICPCIVLCRERVEARPSRDGRLDGRDKLPFGGGSRRFYWHCRGRRAGDHHLPADLARLDGHRDDGERHPPGAAVYWRAQPHALADPVSDALADPVAQPVTDRVELHSAAAADHAAAVVTVTDAARHRDDAAGAAAAVDHDRAASVAGLPLHGAAVGPAVDASQHLPHPLTRSPRGRHTVRARARTGCSGREYDANPRPGRDRGRLAGRPARWAFRRHPRWRISRIPDLI